MKIERYITSGIQAEVSLQLQLLLWELQTKLRQNHKEIDYLQVYTLEVLEDGEEGNQIIRHQSEVPEYEACYSLAIEKPVKKKIYIIEDKYADKIVETMLLAWEY